MATTPSYKSQDGRQLWITTEHDRSVTTLLLPEEYIMNQTPTPDTTPTPETPARRHRGLRISTPLGILFVILKLCHVIAWSWLWVLSPFWLGFLWSLFILVIVVTVSWLGRNNTD